MSNMRSDSIKEKSFIKKMLFLAIAVESVKMVNSSKNADDEKLIEFISNKINQPTIM